MQLLLHKAFLERLRARAQNMAVVSGREQETEIEESSPTSLLDFRCVVQFLEQLLEPRETSVVSL